MTGLAGRTSVLGHTVPAQAGLLLGDRHDPLGHIAPDFAALVFDSSL